MISALIVEDEKPAAERLRKLLAEVAPGITVTGTTDTIESTVKWISSNPAPDLILLDIQLGDGLSFNIFKKVKIESFVIFTTAYDEYALKAFELNSIDYLLKPVERQKLSSAIEKFMKYRSLNRTINIDELLTSMENRKQNSRKRFTITIGEKIKVIEVADLAWAFSFEKNTFLCTTSGKQYPVEFSLDTLETMLDPNDFFRINRQYISSFRAITSIRILSKSRIMISLDPPAEEELIVSSSRTSDFRKWLER